MASNRMMVRELGGTHTEALHLFCEVQDGEELYLIAAGEKEAHQFDWYRAWQKDGRWQWKKENETSNPRMKRCLRTLTDAYNSGQDVFGGSQYKLAPGKDTLEYTGRRIVPLCGREVTFSLPLTLAWAGMELLALWYSTAYLCLPEWCMTYLPFLSRTTALFFVAVFSIGLSYLLFHYMEPDWYSALCAVTAPPGFLLCIPVVRLYPFWGTLLLIAGIIFAGMRVKPVLELIQAARTPRYRRQAEQLALGRLGDVLWAMTIVIAIMVMRRAIPPFVLAAQATAPTTTVQQSPEEAWDSYKPTLMALSSSNWASLDMQQRIDLLQQVVDYEAAQTLGCTSAPVEVVISKSEHTLGSYSEPVETISIDRDHLMLDSEASVVDTVLHELRHHYQKQLMDCARELQEEHPDYLAFSYFDDVKELLANEENYVSSDDDLDGYYSQPLEADARSWADQRMHALYRSIIDNGGAL